MATIADRIIRALRQAGPLDDDVLARRLGVSPRQSINQAARALESMGTVRRYVGREGKLVSELVAWSDVDNEHEVRRTTHRAPSANGGLISEDDVKAAVKDHLGHLGYVVRVAWGRERGIDIDATHSERPRLIIEAKGQAAKPGAQQVNYFLGAIGELVQRMDDPGAQYGLALSEHRQYLGLISRLPRLARERMSLVVYFVGRDANDQLVVRAA